MTRRRDGRAHPLEAVLWPLLGGATDDGPVRTVGWVVAGLLALVVLVEMVVLAVMAAFVALPLALVPVAVVVLAAALIIRDVRRRLRP